MALYIASLNSGSNGNCYYVGNILDAVLIDVGISKPGEQKKNETAGHFKKVKAIFFSHEHSDHIKAFLY